MAVLLKQVEACFAKQLDRPCISCWCLSRPARSTEVWPYSQFPFVALCIIHVWPSQRHLFDIETGSKTLLSPVFSQLMTRQLFVLLLIIATQQACDIPQQYDSGLQTLCSSTEGSSGSPDDNYAWIAF